MNLAAQERTERRLAAILTADLVGYSRLMGRDEEGTHAALKALRRELTDPSIQEHRGRIVKSTGDGLLAEFASVVDAVRCAVSVQNEMAQRNAAAPIEQRMEFRIGINLGDIIIDENDIFGDGVNIAARLEPLAEPGGICISQVVLDQVRDKLSFAYEDMGERQVKNIARPLRVYRIPIAETAAPSAAAHAKRNKLGFRIRLRGFFSLGSLATIICVAMVAGVLPRSLAPFLQFGEKDKIPLRTSEAPSPPPPTESRALAAPPEAQTTSVIGEPIFFEKGKVTLSDAARSTIDQQAAFLQDNPKITVTIEGHCSPDEGSREGPAVLAQLRANQVRNALRERGIADSRSQAIGYADAKAAAGSDSEASPAQNRRVILLRN
jgi:class 3 adenylate cyclase/outer membrane protein OmpA-like peptidoglycan-associated protein